ncbi:hypothetical protein C8R44DRAFT_561038, partial [Mycena epipterygia]
WLSQANHVFSQLAIPPKHEDCCKYSPCYRLDGPKSCAPVLVDGITYYLRFSGPVENLPEGYFFLCPLEDLRSNDGAWLATTEHPAYWSLDPTGGIRLCPEDASRLGFPFFEFKITVLVFSWPENVYAGFSRFHAGKGFDPNSQDIARHLGHQIYEL